MEQIYDVIIIGSGIAGLYAGYNITKDYPEKKILILERYHKKYIGGRMNNESFQGVKVVTGAGVGRKRKDKLLIRLLKELNIPTHEFQVKHSNSTSLEPKCNLKETFLDLKKRYNENPVNKTFKEFALPVLGESVYKNFTMCSGYTDYENEHAYSTFNNYGFNDNYDEWTALSIPWKLLVDTLVDKIGENKIKTNCEVLKIKPDNLDYIVQCEKKDFITKKIIIATTIDSVLKILPNANKENSIYKEIHGQPFLRLYGKFSKESNEIMKNFVKGMTNVEGPLQKILAMNTEKGVYMISYSDNDKAKSLKNKLENNESNRRFFENAIEKALGLERGSLHLIAISDYYWKIGTHYYEPLGDRFKTRNEFVKIAQHPFSDIAVVGEMISVNQGWVEGALESVEAVLKPKWMSS
jgi:hypothetical protein